MEGVAAIDELVDASRHAKWFAAFRSLYDTIHEHGGIISIRDIPKPVIEAL
jgi:hypothetical protein